LSQTAPEEVTATVRLIGQEMENYEVPVSILVNTLSGLQKIVYYLATVQEELTVGQRFRLPQKFSNVTLCVAKCLNLEAMPCP
jgi:hypothetical protein